MANVSKSTAFEIRKTRKERNEDLSRKKCQDRPVSVVNRELIPRVRKRVERNPFGSIARLAKGMGASHSSIRKLLEKLDLRPGFHMVQHDIMPGQEREEAAVGGGRKKGTR